MWVTFCVCKQLMELARPSQNQLVKLMHSLLPLFLFFFQTKPMGLSSAWFPLHAKTSHTSSGTKHCTKLFSYSIETHRGINRRHLPFFTGLLGKPGDTGNASDLWKTPEIGSAAVYTLWCSAERQLHCSFQELQKEVQMMPNDEKKTSVKEKDYIPLGNFQIVSYFQFCCSSFSFPMATSSCFLSGMSLWVFLGALRETMTSMGSHGPEGNRDGARKRLAFAG